jgi:hypothetical protein
VKASSGSMNFRMLGLNSVALNSIQYKYDSALYAGVTVDFLIAMWTVALIVCAGIERFLEETLGINQNISEVNQSLIPNEDKVVEQRKWADILRNHIENLVHELDSIYNEF